LIPHNALNVAGSAHCAATTLDGTGRANPHGTIALASSGSFAQKGDKILHSVRIETPAKRDTFGLAKNVIDT
jgi:hypothetical protein